MSNLNVVHPQIKLHEGMMATTSLNVAEVFGRRHRDVFQKVKKLGCSPDFASANFCAVVKTIKTNNGGSKVIEFYSITRDGFIILAMGFTGEKAMQFKEDYISAFNQMEAELLKKHAQPALPDTISPEQHRAIQKAMGKRVYGFNDSRSIEKRYAEEWNAFKDAFHVGKIEQLALANFDDAMVYLGGCVKTLWIDSGTVEVNESELKALGNRLDLMDTRYQKVHQIKARMYGLQCEMDGLIADMNTFVSQTSDPVNEAVAIAKHLIN